MSYRVDGEADGPEMRAGLDNPLVQREFWCSMFFSAYRTAGPMDMFDMDLDWSHVMSTYEILYAEDYSPHP